VARQQLDVLRTTVQYLLGCRRRAASSSPTATTWSGRRAIGADGIDQCYAVHSLRLAAELFALAAMRQWADRCDSTAKRIAAAFDEHFWAGDRCVEYLHPPAGRSRCTATPTSTGRRSPPGLLRP
jgi:hypothetical protein